MDDKSTGDILTEIASKWGPWGAVLFSVFVPRIGRISDGIASVWNAYADRIRAHTEDLRGRIEDRKRESIARARRAEADADLALEAIKLRREEAAVEALRRSALLDNVGRTEPRASRRTGGK